MKSGIIILLLLLIFQVSVGQAKWQNIQTVEEVCTGYPHQIKSIFLNLNLDYPGLEKVKTALSNSLVRSYLDTGNPKYANYIDQFTKDLILSSIPQHAPYAGNFHAQGNWLTMEISGLATAASSWPEYRKSPAWMDYSIKTMVAGMKEQVYPDGVQTELTSSYHLVALSNFNLFAEICKKNKAGTAKNTINSNQI